MITLNTLAKSIWFIKTTTHLVGFETDQTTFKEIHLNLETKELKITTCRDFKLFFDTTKAPTSEDSDKANFLNNAIQLFDGNPFWAIVPQFNVDHEALDEALITSISSHETTLVLKKYLKLLDPSGKFLEKNIYRNKEISLSVKDQILTYLAPLLENSTEDLAAITTPKRSPGISGDLDAIVEQVSLAEDEETVYDFGDLKKACIALIEDVAKEKNLLTIRLVDESREYTYVAKIKKQGIVFSKKSSFLNQKMVLNFDENTLFVNDKKDNESDPLFIKYFREMIRDIESNLASVE